MDYLVESQDLPGQPTIARRARLPVDRIGPWLAESYAQIVAYVQRSGVAMVGPPYARYVFAGDEADVEAGFPVAGSLPRHEDLMMSALPTVTAAVTTHIGSYELLPAAYKAAHAWITDHGGEPLDGHWEVYYDDPAQVPDGSRWRTDVVVPYRTRPGGAGAGAEARR
jgi:effector-binding domain-containing protein